MTDYNKPILIIDEAGFSRICSAILESEGYSAEVVSDLDHLPALDQNGKGLVIISYPYGVAIFGALKALEVPCIILSDQLNKDLIGNLEGFNNSYCMIKPIDYPKFRSLVKSTLEDAREPHDGYKIL